MPLSRRSLLLGSAGLALAGCGSSDAGFDPDLLQSIAPILTLHWAPRRRGVEAPSTANLAEISVRSVAFPTKVATLTVRREESGVADTEPLTQTLTLPVALPLGQVDVTVRFYDESPAPAGGTRLALVAVAKARVVLARPEGVLPSIAVAGRIAGVEVRANQLVPLGLRQELEFVVTDTSGTLLALSPGAAFFEIVEGAGTVLAYEPSPGAGSPDAALLGSFLGLELGTARVRVRVAEQVSAPVTVTVVPFAPWTSGLRIAYLSASELVWDSARQRLWFLDGPTQTVLRSIDPVTGAIDPRTLTAPRAMRGLALSPGRDTLYGVSGGTTGGLAPGRVIRRFSLTTLEELTPLSLPSSASSLPEIPFAPLPGGRILVAARLNGKDDVAVYADTTPLPVTLQTLLDAEGLDGSVTIRHLSASDDGTWAFLDFMASRGNLVVGESWRVRLGPQGLVLGSLEIFPWGRFASGQLLGDESFSDEHKVYSATTGTLLHTFLGQVSPSGITPTYIATIRTETPHTLALVSATDFTERGRLTLPTALPGYPGFVGTVGLGSVGEAIGWGTSGLALRGVSAAGHPYILLVEGVAGL